MHYARAMDPSAAGRARRKQIRDNLTQVYTDEEASPPEWLDLFTQVKEATAALSDRISKETEHFTGDPDIRAALARRERTAQDVRRRVDELNAKIRRLNLLAPHARFTRPALDADRILRPLFRSERRRDPI